MNTETHPDATHDTTLTGPSDPTPDTQKPKRKRNARRKNGNAQHSDTSAKNTPDTNWFSVPVGDAGEVVPSAWHFGG